MKCKILFQKETRKYEFQIKVEYLKYVTLKEFLILAPCHFLCLSPHFLSTNFCAFSNFIS